MLGAAALVSRHEAPRALLHRPGDELFHPIDLGRRRGTRIVAHDDATDLFRGHVRDQIDRNAFALDPREVLGEGRPILCNAVGLRVGEAVARRDRGALAKHVERHALPHLALRQRIGQHGNVGVRVEVDESRCDAAAGRIDDADSRRIVEPSNGGDAAVPDADVAREPRIPVAVEKMAAANDHVVRRVLAVKRGRCRRDRGCGDESDQQSGSRHDARSFTRRRRSFRRRRSGSP